MYGINPGDVITKDKLFDLKSGDVIKDNYDNKDLIGGIIPLKDESFYLTVITEAGLIRIHHFTKKQWDTFGPYTYVCNVSEQIGELISNYSLEPTTID